MGKKISRHARTPTSSLSNRIREATGFAAVVSDQPVLLNDQVNVMLTGLREPMFQHQTVATGFHVSPLGSAAPAKKSATYEFVRELICSQFWQHALLCVDQSNHWPLATELNSVFKTDRSMRPLPYPAGDSASKVHLSIGFPMRREAILISQALSQRAKGKIRNMKVGCGM